MSWQIVPTALFELLADPDPERSQRVMQAMLKMKKIEIDALEHAAAAGVGRGSLASAPVELPVVATGFSSCWSG